MNKFQLQSQSYIILLYTIELILYFNNNMITSKMVIALFYVKDEGQIIILLLLFNSIIQKKLTKKTLLVNFGISITPLNSNQIVFFFLLKPEKIHHSAIGIYNYYLSIYNLCR